MGAVFLAEQDRPVRRRVALKLIREGADSETVLARFEAERQALAMMDHPHIARVFDGGTTPSGRPFFAMEFVRGVPITRYCDEHRLAPEARLALFVQVCEAVQHAHQKGVIHRDLKPNNVLMTEVDGRPAAKVIDFGVAKATGGLALTDQTLRETGVIVGTPTYMSPEQASPSSMDIDTRTDVYALGVLLYELLTGTTPIDPTQLSGGSLLELLRMLREVDPPRPSTRLSRAEAAVEIADRRAVEPSQLVTWLRGDIDWIVMKALEKDRDRRYATAQDFAADVRRFLADEPIMARPPSPAYRLRKFVRRNRGPVAAAAALLLAMLAGIVGTTLGLIEARAQHAEADRARGLAVAEAAAREEARRAEAHQRVLAERANRQAFDALKAFTDDLMSKLLGGRSELTAVERSILANAQEQWEVFARSRGDSAEARVIRAEGMAELALLQAKLGMNREAETNDRGALRVRAGLAADFPDVPIYRLRLGMSHQNLGAGLRSNGNRAEAEEQFRRAVDVFGGLVSDFPDDADYRRRLSESLISLGNAERARSDWTAAERRYREALVLQERLTEDFPDSPTYRRDLADAHWALAFTLRRAGRIEDAEDEYRIALDLKRRLAADFPGDVDARHQAAQLGRELGTFLYDNGRDEDGAALFPEAIATMEGLADEYPSMPTYRHGLFRCCRDHGKVLGYLGRRGEADEQFRASIAVGESLVADFPEVRPYQVDLGLSYSYFAEMLLDAGDPAASLGWTREAIRVLTAAYEQDRQVILTQSALSKCHRWRAEALGLLGRPGEALPEWDLAVGLAPPEDLAAFRGDRAVAAARAERFEDALAELAELTESDPADPIHWLNLARVHALAGAAVEPSMEEHAGLAVEALRRAVGLGYADGDPGRIAEDPDLAPLRGRDDFEQLLADLGP